MDFSIRYYLFADDGVKGFSQQLIDGLIGHDAMPEYANTKQKAAHVHLELENGKPVRIEGSIGTFLNFDSEGRVRGGLQKAAHPCVRTGSFHCVPDTRAFTAGHGEAKRPKNGELLYDDNGDHHGHKVLFAIFDKPLALNHNDFHLDHLRNL